MKIRHLPANHPYRHQLLMQLKELSALQWCQIQTLPIFPIVLYQHLKYVRFLLYVNRYIRATGDLLCKIFLPCQCFIHEERKPRIYNSVVRFHIFATHSYLEAKYVEAIALSFRSTQCTQQITLNTPFYNIYHANQPFNQII